MSDQRAVLLVANWDSGVGYAWWLMESFWVTLAQHYSGDHRVLLAYPSISTLSQEIHDAPIEPVLQEFREKTFGCMAKQCRFLRRHRVRLIYLSDWGTWDWRYLLFRLCGVERIVIHDHTPGERTPPAGAKRWLKMLVNRLPGLAADGAIGATEYVRVRLEHVSCFPARKCFAVPNGLPSPPRTAVEAEASVHEIFSIPAGRTIMVMTGRANRYKNVEFVLECMAELVSAGRTGLHFLFIGDGPDLDVFKDRTHALGVTGFCSFPGRRSDVPELLPGCDFAIHPSRGEVGYSLSILEYMRAGLPVVVPDNPSVCGATEDGRTGLVYRRDDLGSAVSTIGRLLDDASVRRELGQAAKETVHERYMLEDAHRALLTAFDVIEAPLNRQPTG